MLGWAGVSRLRASTARAPRPARRSDLLDQQACAEPWAGPTERARLTALLDAPAGTALLVGEPGIGKTWLTDQLAEEATRRGTSSRAGRARRTTAPRRCGRGSACSTHCSRDDSDLAGLADQAADTSAASQAFQTSDRIARALFAVAERTPVLVVLDDLHWSDDATLRTLRHVLATTPADARLVVVATRRAHPEPTGALAEVGEAFARRHALRLDLDGLGAHEARMLVRSVAGPEIPDATADAWHHRAAGNPFFLVELARLDEEDVAEVPATVRDVVTRRLAVLDDRALDTLRLAAVAGRRFQAVTVAAAAAADLDDVLDDLETARAAGLVVEEAPATTPSRTP